MDEKLVTLYQCLCKEGLSGDDIEWSFEVLVVSCVEKGLSFNFNEEVQYHQNATGCPMSCNALIDQDRVPLKEDLFLRCTEKRRVSSEDRLGDC